MFVLKLANSRCEQYPRDIGRSISSATTILILTEDSLVRRHIIFCSLRDRRIASSIPLAVTEMDYDPGV